MKHWEKPVIGSIVLMYILSCIASCQRIISARPEADASGDNAAVTAVVKESIFALWDNLISVFTNIYMLAALFLIGALAFAAYKTLHKKKTR